MSGIVISSECESHETTAYLMSDRRGGGYLVGLVVWLDCLQRQHVVCERDGQDDALSGGLDA